MKQLLFITCLLAGMMYSGYAQTSPGPPKRSMSLSVIEAVQSENSINLFFHTDMGIADIKVIAPSGITVYQDKINIISGSGMVISTTRWISTDYVIRITDNKGNIIKEIM